MKHFFRSILIVILTASIFFVSACSSKKAEKNGVALSGSACNPTQASAGDPILCEKPENFSKDCRCFLDEGQRELFVDCQEVENGLQVTAPSIAGTGDLIFRCGSDEPVILQKNITISPRTGTTDNVTQGGETAPQANTAACFDETDCVAGKTCDKPSGACIESSLPTSTSPAAPTLPTVAAPFAVSIKATPSKNVLGVVRMDLSASGYNDASEVESLYVYGPMGQNCSTVSPIVDLYGNAINPAAPIYAQNKAFMDHVVKCDENAAAGAPDFCEGYQASPGEPENCRVDLTESLTKGGWSGGFYTDVRAVQSQFVLVGKKKSDANALVEKANLIDMPASLDSRPKRYVVGCPRVP